ncbi:MAG: NADH-quinone oxidoreductase subunit N [Candidatus Ranarchaeia archaeon]
MLDLISILSPTFIFVFFGVSSIPLIRFTRHRLSVKIHHSLSVIWMMSPFIISMVLLTQIYTTYYSIDILNGPLAIISLVSPGLEISSSVLLVDALSLFMATVYLVTGSLTCLFNVLYIKSKELLSERYYALSLLTVGMVLLLTFAGDLFTVSVIWESITAGASFLIIYNRKNVSIEGAFKFLVMAILASGFIVYGLSIIYGLTGTMNFWQVKTYLILLEDKRLLVLGFAFIAAGFGIETALVPFHMWLPDVYTAAPASTSSFLSALVDQASYYVLIRILIYILVPWLTVDWVLPLAIITALTITLGNLFALIQNNLKRMVTYVVIADIGYNMIAITSVTPIGLAGNLYFFMIGGLTTALAFMVIGLLNRIGVYTLDDLKGVGRNNPLPSFALVIGAFSFSGVPPLAGFIAKYLVFTAALEGPVAWLAVIGVVNSVIQASYFLRIISIMFRKTQENHVKVQFDYLGLVPAYIIVAILVVVGLFPALLLNLIDPVVQQMSLILG